MKRFYISILLFFVLSSCGDVKFVVKMNNTLTSEYRANGTYTYVADQMTTHGKDSLECEFDRNLTRLNSIIPIDSLAPSTCRFTITYEYYLKMRHYVKSRNSRQYDNLDIINKKEYDSMNKDFDSIYINSLNIEK